MRAPSTGLSITRPRATAYLGHLVNCKFTLGDGFQFVWLGNPYFSFENHGHMFFTELRLDEAGEWSSTNKEFLRQLKDELGCNAEWCCGFDKRDAANAENAVKQVEIRAKSITDQPCCIAAAVQ